MSLQVEAVSFDAHDPQGSVRFWANMLNRDIIREPEGALLHGDGTQNGDGTQIGLRFIKTAVPNTGPNRAHLHLTSSILDEQLQIVAKALDLGAHHVDVGQRPEEGHVVLTDPSGNEFTVANE